MDYAEARKHMVDGQLRPNKVTEPSLLAAFGRIGREGFVPAALRARAYADDIAPIGPGRALTSPMVLARLIQAAKPRLGRKALIVGAGSGYSAAILAEMGLVVTAVESDADLIAAARPLLAAAIPGAQPSVVQAELPEGNAAGAPYDMILIDGAVPEIPATLIAQLADGGALVTVLSEPGRAPRAVLGTKSGAGFHVARLFDAHAPALPGMKKQPVFAL
jgi:protein-L-isoaspartate(D-aspartate) O-methyltransferase